MGNKMENSPNINWKNFFICFAISIGNISFGYPAAIIGTTLSQPGFLAYMGLETASGKAKNAAALEGAMNGVFQTGALFGIFSSEWVMGRYGRKLGVLYAAVLSIIGGIFVTASQNVAMFIAFRFVAGAGSGLLQVCPVYCSELSPPSLRGFFVGVNGVLIATGYALASYMGLAFNSINNNPEAQWRGPLGMALVFAVIMVAILPFIPESPRWLLMNGRQEEAWRIIKDIHDNPADPEHEFARREFYQIRKQIELDRTLDCSWTQMFRKPSYRKRSLLVIAYAFLGESTAMLVIANYSSVLYSRFGYNSHEQIALQTGYNTVPIIGNIIGALILDKVGRRPLMLVSIAGCLVFISIETVMMALYTGTNHNSNGTHMGVAALYCFIFCYAVGADVAGIVFYGEIFPNHIRAKGFSMAVGTKALTDLVYLEAASTSFANIGWRFFLLFISIMTIGLVVMYFVLPETKRVPLEEIAAIFGDKDEVVCYLEKLHIDRPTHNSTGNDGTISGIVTDGEDKPGIQLIESIRL